MEFKFYSNVTASRLKFRHDEALLGFEPNGRRLRSENILPQRREDAKGRFETMKRCHDRKERRAIFPDNSHYIIRVSA